MKTDFLERIFYTASSEHGQPTDGRRINELYEFMPERITTYDAIDSRLTELGISAEDICNELTYMADAYERQGFINGFRLGMMLQEEVDVSKLDTRKEGPTNA